MGSGVRGVGVGVKEVGVGGVRGGSGAGGELRLGDWG